MAAATGKPFKSKKPFKKGGNKQLGYLTAADESLVKKGLRNAVQAKKCIHCYDSSSSDSDSE